jgi:hypothetical protein
MTKTLPSICPRVAMKRVDSSMISSGIPRLGTCFELSKSPDAQDKGAASSRECKTSRAVFRRLKSCSLRHITEKCWSDRTGRARNAASLLRGPRVRIPRPSTNESVANLTFSLGVLRARRLTAPRAAAERSCLPQFPGAHQDAGIGRGRLGAVDQGRAILVSPFSIYRYNRHWSQSDPARRATRYRCHNI